MTPDVVVDIGNSRIKWGRWREGSEIPEMVSLPADDLRQWESQLRAWKLETDPLLFWAVAGVQPAWQDRFFEWASDRGHIVEDIDRKHIPIPIEVDEPDAVGIDRLLNALAANRLKPADALAVVISVGTAVTVDLVREDGAFAGGTIFPGPRLMAESLHRFTAKLPILHLSDVVYQREPPCRNTLDAMQTGISLAIMGGVSHLVDEMTGFRKVHTSVIMTGGALGMLADFDFGDVENTLTRPTLTLEGIRIAAESLP